MITGWGNLCQPELDALFLMKPGVWCSGPRKKAHGSDVTDMRMMQPTSTLLPGEEPLELRAL